MCEDLVAWLSVVAAFCSAMAAGANCWIVYTDRTLKERQIKRDLIRRFMGMDCEYPKDLGILNEIGVVFNDIPAVVVAQARLYKAISTRCCSEIQKASDRLIVALHKAANLKVIAKTYVFIKEE